jgi:hypothetical protein
MGRGPPPHEVSRVCAAFVAASESGGTTYHPVSGHEGLWLRLQLVADAARNSQVCCVHRTARPSSSRRAHCFFVPQQSTRALRAHAPPAQTS